MKPYAFAILMAAAAIAWGADDPAMAPPAGETPAKESPATETADGKPVDLEARKASIPVLAQYIGEREARMGQISDDIIRLDQRLEGKIDRLVKRLSSLKDSQNSGYRMSQVKMEALEGLAGTIDNYQSKRASLITEMREQRSGVPGETLREDARAFDKHIEKRIEQIITLSKSFTQDKGYQRYNKGGRGRYRGRSESYQQNRRDKTMDKKQRKEVMDALRKSIDRHKALIAGMKDSLANRKMSKADRDLMDSEMNRHIEILDARQGQLDDLLIVRQPRTSAVTRDKAHELQEALRDATDDLRYDFNTIFLKYAELNKERAKVAKLKNNLAARKKWIEDYEAARS